MTATVHYEPVGPLPEAHSPLRELLTLAAPTVAQMASYTLMQFIDTWLLAHYGSNRSTGLEPTAAVQQRDVCVRADQRRVRGADRL